MTTVDVNGVALGIESFGDDSAPLVLLVGGTTMLSWPDALFPVGNGEAIARGIPEARLLVLEDAAVAIPEGSRELSRRHVAVVGDGAKPQLGDQFEIGGRCRSDPHSSG